MPAHLVRRAIEQSRNREPLVRTMALLCGSRVLSAVDRQAASEAFAKGLSTAEVLPLDNRIRRHVLEEAVRLGATADPLSAASLFRRLPADEQGMRHNSTGTMLVQSLAQGGDFETALGLLEDLSCDTGGAQVVVELSSDPAVQRRALLAARERWRAQRSRPDQPGSYSVQHDFYRVFSLHWRKLEPEEAAAWLDEILLAIKTDPDHPMRAGFGERVELHSARDAHLFEVLSAVRALKTPEQIEHLLHDHPEVAEAAKIFPLGLESMMAQPRPAPEGGRAGVSTGFRFGGGGGISSSGSDARTLADMFAAERGDPAAVERLFNEAHQLYLEDLNADNPNLAPRVFWPSCHAYKMAMYYAGKSAQADADSWLAGIPDTDFALLAGIEFAAGALGLPQHSGVRIGHPPRRVQRT